EIRYREHAGRNALQRSAHQEAITHLTAGLALLEALPNTAERTQQELALQIALGGPLIAAKGYADPAVEHVYTRARALCRQVGETPQVVQALLGLEAFHFVRGELVTARELGEQCLPLAQRLPNQVRLLQTHVALGLTLFHLGEFAAAAEHLQQGITLYDSQPQSPRVLQDPKVVCLAYGALALWHLGYPDQALESSRAALSLAAELAHPFSLAVALTFAAMFHQHRREAQATAAHAEAAIRLATEQGFPLWLAGGTVLRGSALVLHGQEGAAGIGQLHYGLAAWRATGAELNRPYHLALLAEAYGKAGQVEKGLTVLAEALRVADTTAERYREAELYRLQGELLLQQGRVSPVQRGHRKQPKARGEHLPPAPLYPRLPQEANAEVCFQKAIAIARQQQTKSLELRATLSLARLWQQQGKKDEAHAMVAELYGWFTEGFDTADLQEAKALVVKLYT